MTAGAFFLSWDLRCISRTCSNEFLRAPRSSTINFSFWSWATYFMNDMAWENSRHLVTLPLVSPPNDFWETRAETLYWWRVTTQIWVVLLIGCIKFPTRHDQAEALPRSVLWRVISMEFLRSFLGRHLAGKPVVVSRNVGCFLRLWKIYPLRNLDTFSCFQ